VAEISAILIGSGQIVMRCARNVPDPMVPEEMEQQYERRRPAVDIDDGLVLVADGR
jgi:hypothetical protein